MQEQSGFIPKRRVVKKDQDTNPQTNTENSFIPMDLGNTIRYVEHTPSLNKRANVYEFRKLYADKGIDLDKWYQEHAISKRREFAQDDFINNDRISTEATLAEMLPLLANAPGRLGDYITASVTKTARPDDQGNSFVDLVVELKNDWLVSQGEEFADVPTKMTFLVDVSARSDGGVKEKKAEALKIELQKGEKATVKCYQNSLGELGITRPKILVAKTENYIKQVGGTLGTHVAKHAGDSFSITNKTRFDALYQEYFLSFVSAIGQNAQANIIYLKSLPPNPKRKQLADEYQRIVTFVEAYKKTPVTRPKQSA